MEKELIGACGIYCPNCDIYRAWKEDDTELKQKIAENISKMVDKKIDLKLIKCTGCHGPIGTHTGLRTARSCFALPQEMLICAHYAMSLFVIN